MNPEGLKKKIGPLPMWAWVLIVGGGIGVLWYMSSKSSSSSSSSATGTNAVDPNNPLGLTYAQEQQDAAEGIDPNTGVPYNEEQQSEIPGSAGVKARQVAPGKALYQEIRDIELGRKAIRGLGGKKTPARHRHYAGSGGIGRVHHTASSPKRRVKKHHYAKK